MLMVAGAAMLGKLHSRCRPLSLQLPRSQTRAPGAAVTPSLPLLQALPQLPSLMARLGPWLVRSCPSS